MVQDLSGGRIYKGSIAQISVHVLPPCFDPEKVADLTLNFYTEIGGGSVEFSGDTITLEGNIATVVFQPIQLDGLADGLLRYNVSYNYDDEPKTVDLETRFYVKTPNPYEPIKYVTEDTVKEIVDEKVDEGGFATSAETVELISEAMDAESARTESTYAKAEDLEQAINAETARTESTYAKKSDIPSLQGYATETFVDGRVNAEAARAESAYAKPADITAALEGYNPTDNFKTINGNSIIGEGDIEIQGGSGDSNYLIVDSLDEIENPVEGMRAFVNAQYEDKEGYIIIPTLPDNDHFAGRMYINDGEEMYSVYYTGEEGARGWHWDWDNSGQWREREWNGHIIHYQATDTTFNYYFINDNEPYFVPEDSTVEAATFRIMAANAKQYIYYEEYGWIEENMILQEGSTALQYREYFFSYHNPLEHGLFIQYYDKIIKIVSYRVSDADLIYLTGYAQNGDKDRQFIFSYTGHDGLIQRNWENWVFAGDNFISSRQKGIKGGYYYHYTWDRTEDFNPWDDNNRRMIGYLFPDVAGYVISSNQCWDRVASIYHGTEEEHDWSWEIRRNDNDYENCENNGNWRVCDDRFGYRRNIENYNFELFFKDNPEEYTIVLNDNPDINAAMEEATLNAFEMWLLPFQEGNNRRAVFELEGYWHYDYGDWEPTLKYGENYFWDAPFRFIFHWHEEGWLDFYSNIPFAIDKEGDTRLWLQATQGYFTLNDYGYEHFNTIPDILYQNYSDEGDIILFGEDEAQYLIGHAMESETARTENTYAKPADIATALEGYNPTANFKTVNGESIIGEGDIEIQGGLEVVDYNTMSTEKGREIYTNPEKYILKNNDAFFTYYGKQSGSRNQIYVQIYIPYSGNISIKSLSINDVGTKGTRGEGEFYYKSKIDTLLNGKVNNVNGVAGIWSGTQAEYDAIATKDPNTLYVIKG